MAGAAIQSQVAGPLRATTNSQRHMPLEDPGEAVAHLGRRFADGDGARHVGGAVEILGAGIDQIEGAGRELPVGLRRRVIMHHRAVGSGAGNGVEAEAAEMLGPGAARKSCQPLRNQRKGAEGAML